MFYEISIVNNLLKCHNITCNRFYNDENEPHVLPCCDMTVCSSCSNIMLEYKSVLDRGTCSDIQNGSSKQICHIINSISLAVHISIRVLGIWKLLGMISNLPFTIRASSQNILKTIMNSLTSTKSFIIILVK